MPLREAAPWHGRAAAAAIGQARTGTAATAGADGRARWLNWRVLLLLAVLPMFGQVFQYLIDVPPLFYLSKVWPLLMTPFVFVALRHASLSFNWVTLAAIAYTVAFTPLMAVLQLGDDFGDAVSTTAAALAITSTFSLPGLLFVIRPTERELVRSICLAGALTYLALWLLMIVIPAAWYTYDITKTNLFFLDVERKWRIYMPMFMGRLLVFYLNRSFWKDRKFWRLLALAFCFYSMITIYKERVAIGSTALLVVFGAIMSLAPRGRILATVLLLLGGAIAIWTVSDITPTTQDFGGSLTVRLHTTATVLDFLEEDPLRWIFGAGATTRFAEYGLQHMFHDRHFWLTDVGWLGVIFEFGLLGAGLILAWHISGIRQCNAAVRHKAPLAEALGDCILYALVSSPVYSVLYAPGEVAVAIGICAYLRSIARVHPAQALPRPR